MPITPLSAIAPLLNSLKYLISLWRDESSIKIEGEVCRNGETDRILANVSASNKSIVRIAVSSSSENQIELLGIQIEYSSPLQLLDPEQRGFFDSQITLSEDQPFRISWSGSTLIGRKLIQFFAIEAIFPNKWQEHHIVVRTHTKRTHKNFGFLSPGRIQETSGSYILEPISEALLGIAIPPEWSASSPQPFMIESAHTATVLDGKESSIVVHEISKSGIASSAKIRIK